MSADDAFEDEGPAPNIAELTSVSTEVRKLRAAGKLDDASRAILLQRVRRAVPPNWSDLLEEAEREILS